MRSDYNAGFVGDMEQELGLHYLEWFPFCQQAVLSTVSGFGQASRLSELLNVPVDQYDLERLEGAWLQPFRSYLTRSGKLARPYLVCLCIEAYGRDPRQWPLQVALAEIIHSSSLILDDIADDSLFRRGGPTAHQQVGVRVAGSTGVSWMSLGFELVWSDLQRLGPAATNRLFQEMSWEHFVTGLGTTIDVTWAWRGSSSPQPEQYLQEVIHRSTSYTYRLPMKIGGLTGGAPDAEVTKLAAYGEQLGLAFQLIDDILNVKPRDGHWGKEVAEDVAQGKITLQVLLALEAGTEPQRDRLIEILASRTHDPAELNAAVQILEATGALAECQRRAEAMADECKQIAYSLDIPAPFQRRLAHFADYIIRRGR